MGKACGVELYCAGEGLSGVRMGSFCARIFFQGLFEAIHGLVEIIRI